MLNKITIEVPPGVRFLSEWMDFESQIPHGQHIILNKAHTGVGATQYYITNSQNIILCSPRVALIENKRTKHPDVWIYRDLSDTVSSDTDGKSSKKRKKATYEDIQRFNNEVVQYIHRCAWARKPPKIMTTYDSLGHVIDALNSISPSEKDTWTLVIDEFQSIFSDASYKSLTEMRLLANTAQFKSVIYLSATPFLENYMAQMDEFRDLPYITLKWPEEMTEKASVLNVSIKESRNAACANIINKMKAGKVVKFGSKEIDTKEAVFYVNSVVDILRVIKKCNLKQDEVNILCSDSNEERIRKAGFSIGAIPSQGEQHKPFTFCTRSYFFGCDFNSECAYSYIFADPRSDTLALDISTDLSQILGRQRLDVNPYKNEAILFIHEGSVGMEHKEFVEHLTKKLEKTERKIKTFEKLTHEEKLDYIGMIRSDIEKNHYSKDYLCIIDEKNLVIGENKLLWLAECRAWEIRTQNYSSQYTVIKNQASAGINGSIQTKSDNPDVIAFKTLYDEEKHTDKRLKLYSEFCKEHSDLIDEIDFVPHRFIEYREALGVEGMAKVGFQESKIKEILKAPVPFDDTVVKELRQLVAEGKSYSPSQMKEIVGKAYKKAGIPKTAKAKDIENYITASLKQTGKAKKRKYVIDSLYQKNISLLPHIWLPNAVYNSNIDKILDMIEKGSHTIRKGKETKTLQMVISIIRSTTDKKKVAKLKGDWLPAACVNGVFESKHEHGLKSYSSFIALDYDHFSDDARMEEAKEYLKKFEFVYAIFKTPSGHGIKALILHDNANPEQHHNLFSQLQKICYLPEIDNSVNDISRGHYLSYDPDLWRNPNPKAYHYEFDPSIQPAIQKDEKEVVGKNQDEVIQLDSWTSSFLHSLWDSILSDDTVIKRLDKYWHENKPDYYEEGNRHQSILIQGGILCKAGITEEKAKAYLINSYPDMPEDEIESIVEYTHAHNPFGSDRRDWSGR